MSTQASARRHSPVAVSCIARKHFATLLVAVAAVSAGPAAHAAAPSAAPRIICAPKDPNLATYLEMTAKMFEPRDASVAARYYAPQFVSHNSDAGGGEATTLTPAAFERIYGNSKRTYGERSIVNDMIFCAGDYVIARVTMVSKMTGPIGSQAPTGRTARTSAIDIYRFKDGKVVERWGNNDGIGTLWQLGLQLPPAPPSAAPAR